MFGFIYSNFTSRKIITAFGSLFSNTTLVRFNKNGTEQERFVVPCEMGQKEKYWQALQADPNNDKKVQQTLPQIAYNLMGLKYDAQRKQQTTLQNVNIISNNNISTNYMWVPYNYEFEVYVYVRTISDGFQIVEQILPFFTPDYTLIVNLLPSMNITKDVPIILNDVTYEVENEGARDGESRFVQFTLSFTAKGYLFGPVQSAGLIKQAITNIWNWVNEDGKNLYLVLSPGGTGNFLPHETVFQDTRLESSNATATVLDWSANTGRLLIDDVQGMFVSGETLTGTTSGAKWNIINYEIQPQILETITITPNPANANANSAYTYNVAIQTYNTAT